MKLSVLFFRRFYRLQFPVALLIALLQRTPVVRVLVVAEEMVLSTPVSAILKSAVAAVSLGAVHSLAGATQLFVTTPDNSNFNSATVGSSKTIYFTVTGATTQPSSWTVDNAPPGMIFGVAPSGAQAKTSGIINGSTIQVSGAPTSAGSYTLSLTAWQNANASGDRIDYTHVIIVSGGATPTPTPTPTPTGAPNSAPTITLQPQNQSVLTGGNVTFTASASGSPAPTFQWRKDGTNIAGATSSTLTLNNVAATAAGTYSMVATNSTGSATTNGAVLTVVNSADFPAVTASPQSVTIAPGSTLSLAVAGSKVSSYQWRKDGAAISGATSDLLIIPNVSAATAGSYSVVLSNAAGSVTTSSAVVSVNAGTGRISNLSVRTNLASGQMLTVGFVASGNKKLLLRAVGPTLTTVFGLGNAFADPVLNVLNQSQVTLATNDNWNGDAAVVAAANQLGAFPWSVTTSKDAALVMTVNAPAIAQINGTGSGILLMEVYDADAESVPSRLTNVSARNRVGTGTDVLVSGFVVSGTVAKTLLIRGIGPALNDVFGVAGNLADPLLEIFTQSNAKVAENDNWNASLSPYFALVGAYGFKAGSKDSALLVTLPPGVYTAQVSGIASGTGDGVVEVYELP